MYASMINTQVRFAAMQAKILLPTTAMMTAAMMRRSMCAPGYRQGVRATATRQVDRLRLEPDGNVTATVTAASA